MAGSYNAADPGIAIRVVIGSLEVGGAESHLGQVLPRLRERGWAPRVVTLTGLGSVSDGLAGQAIPVHMLPSYARTARWPRSLRRSAGALSIVRDLARELRSFPNELTWMVLPEAYLLTMLAATSIRYRGPLVMSRRSLNVYQHKYPLLRNLEGVFHRRVSVVLANSTAVARELECEEGVPSHKLGVIYNGVDTERFSLVKPRAKIRGALGMATDTLVLCLVANLIPYKGHQDLLRALAREQGRLPDWRLICIGRGDPRALQSLAGSLGVAESVLWLGARSDVPDLLAASDIGVVASHEEGFSNALLEIMASGLPVVATAVGGNPEAVRNGETGLLVAPSRPEALGAGIVRLANDKALAARLGAAARADVARRFSLERCVDAYDRVLRAVIAGTDMPWDVVFGTLRPGLERGERPE